jgi:hypothetical protein
MDAAMYAAQSKDRLKLRWMMLPPDRRFSRQQ